MPEAWRIVKTKYAGSAFTGEGARLYGGRWSSKDRPAVYTSSTVALATLEMLVHLETSVTLPAYSLFLLEIPDALIEPLDPTRLPPDWQAFPAPRALQQIGDAWLISGTTPALRVPSVIVPTEFNYLLNPRHPRFVDLTVNPPRPYNLDPRLT